MSDSSRSPKSKPGFFDEKKGETSRAANPGYIVIYQFQGFPWGHVSLWDGNHYLSFGGTLKWPLKNVDEEAIADQLAEKEKQTYGMIRKIVIPVSEKFYLKRAEIQHDLFASWKEDTYHWEEKNCAKMVEDYLRRMGYLEKAIPVILALTPASLAAAADIIAKKIIIMQIELEAKKELSAEETGLMREFFRVLRGLLDSPKLSSKDMVPSEVRQRLQKISEFEKFTDPDLKKVFCEVKWFLKSVEVSMDENLKKEFRQFCAEMFQVMQQKGEKMLSLVEKFNPSFRKGPR